MAGNPDFSVLLTRPEAQSAVFAADLRARLGANLRVVISPLLQIQSLSAMVDLAGVGLLLFSSPHGVIAASARFTDRKIPTACVGEKTAMAAIDAGFRVTMRAPDAKTLLAEVIAGGNIAGTVLYLRCEHSARPVVQILQNAGLGARDTVVYRQRALKLNAPATALLTGGTKVILPLFSPRTGSIFQTEAEGLFLGNVTAVCLSENVAARLHADRFAAVIVAPSPDAAAVAQEIAAII